MEPRKYEAFIAEFIGTFFLVFTVGLNVLQHTALAPISIGSILMVLVFASGSVSGAHFNPAVSLGVYLSKRDKLSLPSMLIYFASQTVGAVVAGCVYWWILGATFTLQPEPGYGAWDAFIVETLFSSTLVFVVLNVATTEEDAENHYFGLAIGFTLMAAIFACGPISGCSLNPALVVGATLTHLIHTGSHKALTHFVVYLCAPFVGAVIANGLFRAVRPVEFRQVRVGGPSSKDASAALSMA
eukprot:GEMP01045693.1.p1 GENE.GEMP01045693.1~~GEMP01045693.1.p1  ORF type:complete len:242 (+),score=34.93 GEMP01045693.1:61-786(+)